MFKALISSLILIISFNSYAKIENINITSNPEVLAKGFINNVFYEIENNKKHISENPDYLRGIIKKNIIPYSNSEFASYYVLGKNLRDIEKYDIKEFSENFDLYFEKVIFDFFKEFKDYKITLSNNNRFKNNKAYIQFTVDKKEPIFLDFIFIKKDNIWGFYDIKNERNSVMSEKRIEFDSIIGKNNLEYLTNYIISNS